MRRTVAFLTSISSHMSTHKAMKSFAVLVALPVLLALVTAGCDSGSSGEATEPESMRSEAVLFAESLPSVLGATPSTGCGLEPPVTVGQPSSVVLSPGTARDGSYELYLPEQYDRNHPTALVVGLHGWTSSGSSDLRGSGSDKSADAFGYITAWPNGVAYPQAGRGWAFPGCNASPPAGTVDLFGRRAVCDDGNEYSCDSTTCPSESALGLCDESGFDFSGDGNASCLYDDGGAIFNQTTCDMASGGNCNWCGCVDDEAFVRAVVEHIAATACVDLNRVYLTGMSQGGMMTSWLYSRAGDLFAAFAPQSGTNPRDFYANPPTTDTDASVLFVHGTSDNVVPYDGRPAGDGYNYMSVLDEVIRMSNHAFGTCSAWQDWSIPSGVNAPSNAQLDCRQRVCAVPGGDDREFVYCTFSGGHVWPKAPGKREASLWGNRLVWEFFVSHCNETGNGCSESYTPPNGGGGGGGGDKPGKGCNPKKDPDCVK
jgi:poly(3-hydroxybutyrate) depolymerase